MLVTLKVASGRTFLTLKNTSRLRKPSIAHTEKSIHRTRPASACVLPEAFVADVSLVKANGPVPHFAFHPPVPATARARCATGRCIGRQKSPHGASLARRVIASGCSRWSYCEASGTNGRWHIQPGIDVVTLRHRLRDVLQWYRCVSRPHLLPVCMINCAGRRDAGDVVTLFVSATNPAVKATGPTSYRLRRVEGVGLFRLQNRLAPPAKCVDNAGASNMQLRANPGSVMVIAPSSRLPNSCFNAGARNWHGHQTAQTPWSFTFRGTWARLRNARIAVPADRSLSFERTRKGSTNSAKPPGACVQRLPRCLLDAADNAPACVSGSACHTSTSVLPLHRARASSDPPGNVNTGRPNLPVQVRYRGASGTYRRHLRDCSLTWCCSWQSSDRSFHCWSHPPARRVKVVVVVILHAVLSADHLRFSSRPVLPYLPCRSRPEHHVGRSLRSARPTLHESAGDVNTPGLAGS